MRCPFLREAQVKFCCASEFKKLIARTQTQQSMPGGVENGERCASPAYVTCPSAKQRFEDLPSQDHCPFLQESLCQYCAAASVVKYVPYSDPTLTRCGTSSHRYCELLMTMQNPRLLTPHDVVAPEIDSEDEDTNGYWVVDGIQTVGWLHYSPNHMWADFDEDGTCHVGIDAFLAKVLGRVERLTFATAAGAHTPAVSITVNGTDLQIVFPKKISVSSVNSHLRAEPNKIVSDPYTLGWLFEGKYAPIPGREQHASGTDSNDAGPGLIHGRNAKHWMQEETRRLTELVSGMIPEESTSARNRSRETRLMADGGMFMGSIFNNVSREEMLLLYNEFFAPQM